MFMLMLTLTLVLATRRNFPFFGYDGNYGIHSIPEDFVDDDVDLDIYLDLDFDLSSDSSDLGRSSRASVGKAA